MLVRIVIAGLFMTGTASAQMMQWGTGMAMGQQGCGYPQQVAKGAVSEDDGVSELVQAQKDLKQTLQEKKKKLKTLERDLEKLHDTVSESLNSETADFAFAHMENGHRCEDYQASGPDANKLPLKGFNSDGLARYCDNGKAGYIRGDICSDNRYRISEGRKSDVACKKALPDYRKKYAESQKTVDEIERTEKRLEDLKTDIAEARKEARTDRQNRNTEGDVCLECLSKGNGYQPQAQQRQTDWAGVAANVGTGLAAMYMGYKTNKMVAEYNSDLGFPTQSYPTWGYGLPYMASGLYGAMGGSTGQGAFGCGSTGGGMMASAGMSGSVFGYPQSMYSSPMSGGMYSYQMQAQSQMQSQMQRQYSLNYGLGYGYGTGTSSYLSGTSLASGVLPAPSTYSYSSTGVLPAPTTYNYNYSTGVLRAPY